MQPLTRTTPRLFTNSIAVSPARKSFRVPTRPSPRAATCTPCRNLNQARHLADSNNPPSSRPPSPSGRPSAASTDPVDSLLQQKTSETEKSTPTSTPPRAEKEDVHPTDLPSTAAGSRLEITKRFSHLMDHVQGNIFIASQRINDLTGYSGIEALKSRITDLESRVATAADLVRSTRSTYKTTVADRAATQREVTTLLARKDSWTPGDLERFTALYRMDHSNEQAVQNAATALADAERDAEAAASKLSSSILSRYHEEQIWSDKIRRMSTWGTWGLMGVNVLLFLVFQFGFEPWRRRRLVHGFEEKVREALEKEKFAYAEQRKLDSEDFKGETPLDAVVAAGVEEIQEEMNDAPSGPDPAIGAVEAIIEEEGHHSSYQEVPVGVPGPEGAYIPTLLKKLRKTGDWMPSAIKASVEDMFSEKKVDLKRKDVSIIALEGAATGAAIVGIIATIIFRSA